MSKFTDDDERDGSPGLVAGTAEIVRTPSQLLLLEIEDFLSHSRMGASHFGKISTGNSELVGRLRNGGTRVSLESAEAARAFIKSWGAETEKAAGPADMGGAA